MQNNDTRRARASVVEIKNTCIVRLQDKTRDYNGGPAI